MRDFIRFIRHLFETVHFIRGIVLALALQLLLCVIVVVLAEGMPIGQAVYFVLITALTIGYGDITPNTPWGRVASVAAGAIGMLITGIIAAATVRALSQAVHEKHQEQDAKK
jgi:hypothetical protein